MIELIPIPLFKLQAYITLSYWEDFELFEFYHIKKYGNAADAVLDQYEMIENAAQEVDLRYYAVKYNGDSIGYTVVFENCLYSFGINIRFRQAVILQEWMYEVRRILNNEFKCFLYSINTRAIKFLKRNNCRIVSEDKEKNLTILINEYSAQS